MKHCVFCHQELENDAVFCTNCGKRQPENAKVQDEGSFSKTEIIRNKGSPRTEITRNRNSSRIEIIRNRESLKTDIRENR